MVIRSSTILRLTFRVFLFALFVSLVCIAANDLLKVYIYIPVMKFAASHLEWLAFLMGFIFVIGSSLLVFILWWVAWADQHMKSRITKYVSKLVAPDYYKKSRGSDFQRAIKTYINQSPPGTRLDADDVPKKGGDVREDYKDGEVVPVQEDFKKRLMQRFKKRKKSDETVLPDDTYKTYHKNGKLKEEFTYKNGVMEGRYRKCYPDGSLHQEKFYKNGQLNGIFKAWDESGILYFEIGYKNGVYHGKEKEYYKSGILQFQTTYKNGEIINKKTYSQGGSLVSNHDFFIAKKNKRDKEGDE